MPGLGSFFRANAENESNTNGSNDRSPVFHRQPLAFQIAKETTYFSGMALGVLLIGVFGGSQTCRNATLDTPEAGSSV